VILIRDSVMTSLREFRAAKATGGAATSVLLENLEFIDSFVEEIESTELARRAATESSGTIWHYRFNSFRDIVEALRVALQLHGSVTRGALLASLNWELAENLSLLCQKQGRLPLLHAAWIRSLRGRCRWGPTTYFAAFDSTPRRPPASHNSGPSACQKVRG
jgi:hypothetical protein